ncbi:hypothetical protein J7U46_19460 [Pelomonas sp. V22]|uniref:hypothetical protein n=1 Tax=Pelomonas sp. V22 TaxID=2822139 RepID=UPI0024A8EA29|nr:hypothetical protein [Pelomonas sp. V22]MDI4635250.1 hypothetical protein [Pelomonas sp. V22]
MRLTVDANHEELSRILDELLAVDVDISAREIARRHSVLKNASAFTRHTERAGLIAAAQRRQTDARNVRELPVAKKAATLAEQLAEKSARVEELERQVAGLVASHAACVRAVMQHGGVRALQQFWMEYRGLSDILQELNALPAGAKVIPIGQNLDFEKAKIDI